MKKLLTIFLFVLINSAQSQNRTDLFLLDYTVPDMPAFKALGTNPSEILRPSDVKKLSTMVAPFNFLGKALIPSGFAMEAAPWKLASKKWTLDDYRNSSTKRLLYGTSLSLGTSTGKENSLARNIAFGIRSSVISKKDNIMLNDQISDAVFKALDSMRDEMVAERRAWANLKGYDIASLTTEQQEEFNKYWFAVGTDKTKPIIDSFEKSHWNESRLDFAIAFVGTSPDSLLKNIEYNNLQAWITKSYSSGKNGQLLLGISFNAADHKDSFGNTNYFTGNLRYYLGAEDIRGFAEGQFKNHEKDIDNKVLLNFGIEFRVLKDFWFVFNAGADNLSDDAKFVSNFDIRYSFNRPQ